jgi:hypothetical protein
MRDMSYTMIVTSHLFVTDARQVPHHDPPVGAA